MKSDDEDKKVFDVSRPSQVQPHPNSRPIIVSHQPSAPDPMVNEPSPKPPAKTDLSHLLPAPDDEPKPETDEPKTNPMTHHNTVVTPSAEFTKGLHQSKEEDGKPLPALVSEEGPNLGKAPTNQEADAKAAKAQEEIERLLASDVYKVPLQSSSRHGLRRHLVLGLMILVLALAAVAYMLLASDFFQNASS